MNIISLMNSIYDNYKDNNYEEAIQEIERYLRLKNVGIFDNVLNIYIMCLIKLGLFDRACENMDIMRRLFPYYYSDLELAVKYSKCLRMDKVDEILNNKSINKEDYYDIACACFFNGNYDKAKELFYNCLFLIEDKDKKKQIQNYLKQISLYERDSGVFREVKYSYFKYKGCKLEPGHVIYVDRLRDEFKENIYNDDPKSNRRPYMIWRIINNKIYAFPLSTKIKQNTVSVIDKKKYPNRDFDRVVKNEMVCLEERDVSEVLDKIKEKDYERIVKNIYRSVCLNHDVPKKSTQLFMNTLVKELKIDLYDVIVIPDFSENKRRYYLVLGFDSIKQKYKVIEVLDLGRDNYQVIGKEVNTVSNKVSILEVIKLDVDKRNKLVEKVPCNFKKINMVGKIVDYNSKKLEIMIEQDDCYICIDRTLGYSPSFISVEFIRNDIPLTIIGELSYDECQSHLYTIRHYLNKNSNNIYYKKKLFKSYSRYMKK